jgi:hypothetical protein
VTVANARQPNEKSDGGAGSRAADWVNWALALLAIPGAVGAVILQYVPILGTAACSDGSCRHLGPGSVLRPHPVRGPSGRGNRRRALLFHRAAAMGIPGAGVHVGTASHRGGGPDHHVPKPAASRPPAICAQKARPAGWVVSRAFALDYCSAASRFSLAFVAPRALSAAASFFAASR